MLMMMYALCKGCNKLIYVNKSVLTSTRCACGNNENKAICWWIAHNKNSEYNQYRDEVLEKCKTCDNRFICHTNLPDDLNKMSRNEL